MSFFDSLIDNTIGKVVDYTIGLPFRIIENNVANDKAKAAAGSQFKQNLEMQQYAQDYNTSERHASQQFLTDFWNKNNAYNEPNEQVSRLRAAGLNPLSASMSNSNAQMVGSSPQASSSAPTVNQSQVFPLSLDSLSFAEFRKTNAEAKSVEIDNRTRNTQNLLSLLEQRARIKNSDMDSQVKQRQLELIDAQVTQIIRQIDIDYKQLGYNERNVEVNEFNAQTQRIAVGIQSALASSKIRVDDATIQNLAASAANLQQQVINGKISAGQAAIDFKKLLKNYRMFYDENNWDSGIMPFLDQLKSYIPFLGVKK